MPTCSVVGCPNGGRKGKMGVPQHKFPEDRDLLVIWKDNIGIVDPDWEPKEFSRVCDDHFCKVIVCFCHLAYIESNQLKCQIRNNFNSIWFQLQLDELDYNFLTFLNRKGKSDSQGVKHSFEINALSFGDRSFELLQTMLVGLRTNGLTSDQPSRYLTSWFQREL